MLMLLSSTHTGEIEAARDALVRAMGGDVHKIADKLLNGYKPAPSTELHIYDDDDDGLSARDMANLLMGMIELGDLHLPSREERFVCDMTRWRKPSARQMNWLRSIYNRHVPF